MDVSNAFPVLSELLSEVTRASVLKELGAVAACLLLAWLLTRQLRRMVDIEGDVLFGKRIVDGVLFPARRSTRSGCAN